MASFMAHVSYKFSIRPPDFYHNSNCKYLSFSSQIISHKQTWFTCMSNNRNHTMVHTKKQNSSFITCSAANKPSPPEIRLVGFPFSLSYSSLFLLCYSILNGKVSLWYENSDRIAKIISYWLVLAGISYWLVLARIIEFVMDGWGEFVSVFCLVLN